MPQKHRLKHIVEYIVALIFSATFFSCSTHPLKSGNYLSVGDYIRESTHSDVWRNGHYLLTIDSLNRFVLKEVSVKLGRYYSVCSGYLNYKGRNTYTLNKIKKEYPYGQLGLPYYNEDDYNIIIKNDEIVILKNGRWKTIMKKVCQDSIPKEFDFTKIEY